MKSDLIMKKTYYTHYGLLSFILIMDVIFAVIITLSICFIPFQLSFIYVILLSINSIFNIVFFKKLIKNNKQIFLTKNGIFLDEKCISWDNISSLHVRNTSPRRTFVFATTDGFTFFLKSKWFNSEELYDNLLLLSTNEKLNKIVESYKKGLIK